ncbi:MAG TPA: DUF4396 domain-containing protein [Bryobacteraceae bacterium]|nr:DUF4396 domain-containing protein [Bryobacteraceae bacterium]
MLPGTNPPYWLIVVSEVCLVVAIGCAVLILFDIIRGHRQKMPVMNVVWPITALYLGPVAVWAYWTFGRSSGESKQKSFARMVFLGDSHCGAGCSIGDFAGEWMVFFVGLKIAGSVLFANYVVDFAAAYLLGIVFQYYAIAPMRNLHGWPGIRAAIKADTISLAAFEVGMFAWMAFSSKVLFQPRVEPTSPVYWFSMQIAMIIGFLTAYPANWWLIRHGWKEKM